MTLKRQQISITKEDFDLIPYYKSKGNYSKFILDCIRFYKDKENQVNEKQIIDIVEDYLSKKNRK